MSVVLSDGHNMIFPIIYVVVESKNIDSWRWFLVLIMDDLNLGDGRGFTMISD